MFLRVTLVDQQSGTRTPNLFPLSDVRRIRPSSPTRPEGTSTLTDLRGNTFTVAESVDEITRALIAAGYDPALAAPLSAPERGGMEL